MNTVDVLAVAAHPDDVEVGCGGTVALCVRNGARVAIADLTSGECSTAGTPELRAAEAQSAAEVLGVHSRIAVGLPDGALGTDPGHRREVVALLRRLRPRFVLAPYHVADRHPDHAAAGRLIRDASFLAGVRRVGSGEPHRPERIYHYMLHHMFAPTFVLDVSEVWDQRQAAVAAYASQFGRDAGQVTAIGGPDFLAQITARAQTLGAMIGAGHAEGYLCEGPLGLDRLPGLDSAAASPLKYRAFL